jgi:hypothetical protein
MRDRVAPDIVDFVRDDALLGLSISLAQETLLRACYGLPLSAEHLDIFRECTGRQTYPAHQFAEITVISGARSGKDSRFAAPIAVYEAAFGGHERYLAKGERGMIPVVAQDARGGKIAFGYIQSYFTCSPLLSSLVDEVLASEITLKNDLTVAVFPCTLKSLRGWSIPVGLLDEVSFFRIEGAADSDVEIQASIRRGMVSFPHTRLIKCSTPYMRSGVLYDDFKRAFGQADPDLLVWKSTSAQMNPTISAERLDRERRLDPGRFAREYLGEFGEDIETFLASSWIERAIQRGRHELPPQSGVRYIAAIDASGGGADAFTLAVVHAVGSGASRRVIHDVMRSWTKPRDGQTDLEGAVQNIATIVKAYGVSTVIGDRYARGWVREAFKRHGLRYDDATVRKDGEAVYLDKSVAYLECEPLFNLGAIEILDHPALERELKNLERRPTAGGRDRVDHPHGQHDDHANALALAAAKASQGGVSPFVYIPDGIARIGEPGPQVGRALGQVPMANRGVAAGQAEWVRRWYR